MEGSELDMSSILDHAREIGKILEWQHPAIDRAIPDEAVTPIADAITLVVAEIIQSWINAGSERDNTLEELGPAIEAHVRSWAVSETSV